jgi:(p)ppGpp synthase/HD superfamily hydrolase
MRLLQKAIQFATFKHEEVKQVRKYTNVPYIVHPIEVLNIVKQSPTHTEEMLIAAVLHDTVEDTNTTLDEIKDNFGLTVMTYVKGLTDISQPTDGKRPARKKIDRDHSESQSAEVQTIKLADLISNAKDIMVHDANGFGKIYIQEKKELYKVLTKGCPILRQQALEILKQYINVDGLK